MSLKWNAHNLRFTVFYAAPLDLAGYADAWTSITGEQPDQDESRPREGVRRQSGTIEGAQLEVVAQANRVDCVLSPMPKLDAGIDVLGEFEKTLRNFGAKIFPWIERRYFGSNRLAIAPTMLADVSDLLDGYRSLAPYIPSVRLEADGSISDFLYQINRKRASSTMPDITLNRAMKWSVARFVNLAITGGEQFLDARSGKELYYCRAEVDVNTAPFKNPVTTFDQAAIVPILSEMQSLCIATAERGELP